MFFVRFVFQLFHFIAEPLHFALALLDVLVQVTALLLQQSGIGRAVQDDKGEGGQYGAAKAAPFRNRPAEVFASYARLDRRAPVPTGASLGLTTVWEHGWLGRG